MDIATPAAVVVVLAFIAAIWRWGYGWYVIALAVFAVAFMVATLIMVLIQD